MKITLRITVTRQDGKNLSKDTVADAVMSAVQEALSEFSVETDTETDPTYACEDVELIRVL